jgi:hypothetical protein
MQESLILLSWNGLLKKLLKKKEYKNNLRKKLNKSKKNETVNKFIHIN